MNKSRSYFKLLEALKESTCPICALLAEDNRAYLDAVFYESVLDVPTRLNLMESFGFCSWHAHQIPDLPSICAPNVGFAIFASDLLRKMVYLGGAMTENRRRNWISAWFKRKRRTLLSLIKARVCPACEHVKQFETYRLKDLLDAIGDQAFLDTYQESRGICLPHFLLLEETYASHANFTLLYTMQLAKVATLRNMLEEFIRKQDFRFSGQITPEEAKAWKVALDLLTGSPGLFANEMGHDLSQRSRRNKTAPAQPLPGRFSCLTNGRSELLVALNAATHVALYLRKPLPDALYQRIKQLAKDCPRGAVEAIVEDFSDVGYLRSLYEANFSLFYGLGLPQKTTILVDRSKGFLVEDDATKETWRLNPLKNAADLSLTMMWRKFGHAVSLRGVVNKRDCAKGIFCLVADGKREQWCRSAHAPANHMPIVGTNVEIFGWEKWYTGIIEVLELDRIGP
jgi:hypothetical protein